MKVIFLDIDGVLNSGRWTRQLARASLAERNSTIEESAALDPTAVARLNRIVHATGALIVISSSWRICFTLPTIAAALADVGFVGTVIGATKVGHWRYGGESGTRGDEIRHWIDAVGCIESFISIDDDPDAVIPGAPGTFIKTWYATGLLDEHVDRAIALLNRTGDVEREEEDQGEVP